MAGDSDKINQCVNKDCFDDVLDQIKIVHKKLNDLNNQT